MVFLPGKRGDWWGHLQKHQGNHLYYYDQIDRRWKLMTNPVFNNTVCHNFLLKEWPLIRRSKQGVISKHRIWNSAIRGWETMDFQIQSYTYPTNIFIQQLNIYICYGPLAKKKCQYWHWTSFIQKLITTSYVTKYSFSPLWTRKTHDEMEKLANSNKNIIHGNKTLIEVWSCFKSSYNHIR